MKIRVDQEDDHATVEEIPYFLYVESLLALLEEHRMKLLIEPWITQVFVKMASSSCPAPGLANWIMISY